MVKNGITDCGDNTMKQMGIFLDVLRAGRNVADYEMGNPAPEKKQNAEAACKQCDKIISYLDNISPADLPAIVLGVANLVANPAYSLKKV